jgi:prepilin-type N-terminal cleavage/methylation domain-containing protein
MNLKSEQGFTVAELMVSVTILLIVLSMTYFALEAVSVSADVSQRQSQFAQEIANPMHGMDKVLSANKAIESAGAFVSDDYTLTTRTTVIEGENAFQRYVYSANEDGTLTERVYRQELGSATSTLLRTRTWTENNTNRELGEPMFTYLGADGAETSPASALSVLVKVCVKSDDKNFSGSRQIFFRNR